MSRHVLIVVSVISLLLPLAPGSIAQGGPSVSVLVDFGDGNYLWADVTLPVENTSALRATELANASLGLAPLEVRWFSFGALVEDIGDRNPAYPEWWHLFLWNRTSLAWDAPSVGASGLSLADGDAIAWFLAVDDPATFASPQPVPTPMFRDVWTSFRGDLSNSGRAHGTIPGTGEVLWDHDLGVLEIDTTPVIAYGMVYVATRSGLFALNAETGREVWRNAAVRSLLSTPSVYDGHLVLGGIDGKLHYVNARDGVERWSVLLEPSVQSTGIASSPAVFQGRAYLGTFGETTGGKGRVVAVNLNNGTVAWSREAPGSIHMSQPVLSPRGDLLVGVMGTYDGTIGYTAPFGLLAFDSKTGDNVLWFEADGPVASSPAFAGSVGFATSRDGSLYFWDESVGRPTAWQRRSIGASTSSVALAGEDVFVGSGGLDGTGRVLSFDFRGNLRWEKETSGGVQASLITDGRLVCGSTNAARGRIFCLRASDGSAAWSYTPAPEQYILGSPAIAGSVMYAPSDNGHVYAFRDAPSQSSLPVVVGASAIVAIVAVSAVWIVWSRRRKRTP